MAETRWHKCSHRSGHYTHHQCPPDERTVALKRRQRASQALAHLQPLRGNPKALFDAGIYYATEQIMDLIDHDVRGIHLYTME